MMAPRVSQQARGEAAIHIQSGGKLAAPVSTPTSVRILGRIERIFRHYTGTLRCGQKIAFTLPVVNPFAQADRSDLFGYDSAGTLRNRLDAIDKSILDGI